MAHLPKGTLELWRTVPVLTEKSFRQARQRKGWGLRLGLRADLLGLAEGAGSAIGPALFNEPGFGLLIGVELLDHIHEGDALTVRLAWAGLQ